MGELEYGQSCVKDKAFFSLLCITIMRCIENIFVSRVFSVFFFFPGNIESYAYSLNNYVQYLLSTIASTAYVTYKDDSFVSHCLFVPRNLMKHNAYMCASSS